MLNVKFNPEEYKQNVITESTKAVLRRIQNIDRGIEAGKKLSDAGFEVEMESWGGGDIYLDIDRKQLPLIHKTLGKLRVHNKRLQDGRKRLLNITVCPIAYDGIVYLTYKRKLPKCQEGPCKIVKVKPTKRPRQKAEYQLVCERPS